MTTCEQNIIDIIVKFAPILVAIMGVFIALWQYKITLFSQKFQNAKTLINSFYGSLKKGDIKSFKYIIELRGEPAGGDCNGHYRDEQGIIRDFSDYFCEGAPDGGRLMRIVNNLERVCYFSKEEDINVQFFYSELGQFINISYEILQAFSAECDYKNITRCFHDMKKSEVPIKVVGYSE